MLQFDKVFFQRECRENFWIEKEMKHAWAAELEVLAHIDRMCKDNGIQYFADSGTLLGAVRHRGFIPWDDDIDICMKREEYLKFISIAAKELPSTMQLLSVYNNNEWDEAFARVTNNTKVDFTEKHLQEWHGCPWVVGVDILPLDVLPDNEEEKNLVLALTDGLRIFREEILMGRISAEEVEEGIRQIEELCGIEINREEEITKQVVVIRDRIAMSYCGEKGKKLASLLYNVGNKVYDKSWFGQYQYVPFENIEIPIPIDYDAVLRTVYGDYMTPVKNGAMHGYPFYAGQKKAWEEFCSL